MKLEKETKLRALYRTMPALPHSVPGQPFDIRASEVVKWLIDQPDVLQAMFNHARSSARISYDSATGTWHGATEAETAEILRQWRETKDLDER